MAYAHLRQVLVQVLESAGVQAGHRADRAAHVAGDFRQRLAVVLLEDQRLTLSWVEVRERF
jgi:hypothetical protein